MFAMAWSAVMAGGSAEELISVSSRAWVGSVEGFGRKGRWGLDISDAPGKVSCGSSASAKTGDSPLPCIPASCSSNTPSDGADPMSSPTQEGTSRDLEDSFSILLLRLVGEVSTNCGRANSLSSSERQTPESLGTGGESLGSARSRSTAEAL